MYSNTALTSIILKRNQIKITFIFVIWVIINPNLIFLISAILSSFLITLLLTSYFYICFCYENCVITLWWTCQRIPKDFVHLKRLEFELLGSTNERSNIVLYCILYSNNFKYQGEGVVRKSLEIDHWPPLSKYIFSVLTSRDMGNILWKITSVKKLQNYVLLASSPTIKILNAIACHFLRVLDDICTVISKIKIKSCLFCKDPLWPLNKEWNIITCNSFRVLYHLHTAILEAKTNYWCMAPCLYANCWNFPCYNEILKFEKFLMVSLWRIIEILIILVKKMEIKKKLKYIFLPSPKTNYFFT